MNNQIKQPIVNSRTLSSRNSSQYLDKSLSGSFEDPLASFLKSKPTPFASKINQPLAHQSSLKGGYTLFKTDPNLLGQLLDQYSQANLFYRDEEFSQQADMFLSKIATERRIPDEFRAKFPLYQILMSLSKIFMLNEFEITVFACMLDHCAWNIDEVISYDEAHLLLEFPSNFGLEISNDCKRFIIYMLVITFSLKQHLGDKSEVDQIQAYCENICSNFQNIYNKWLKVSISHRINFPLPEVNRKFRQLAKRDLNGYQSSVKDYNMLVDEIMGLTGSYTTRKDTRPVGHPQPYIEPPTQLFEQKTQIFHDIPPHTIYEPKPLQGGTSTPYIEEKGFQNFPRSNTLESDSGFIRMPSFIQNFNRQPSFSNFMSNLPVTKRQPSIDNFEEMLKKKLKGEDSNPQPHFQTQPSFLRESSIKPPELNTSFSALFRPEEVGNISLPTLPMLSKKSSRISNEAEDLPSLSRFQSNLSFLYDNAK